MEEIKSTPAIEPVLPHDGSIIVDTDKFEGKQSPAPVSKTDRIQTIDIVRGFALLGILLMNIPGFGIDRSVFFKILEGPVNNRDYMPLP